MYMCMYIYVYLYSIYNPEPRTPNPKARPRRVRLDFNRLILLYRDTVGRLLRYIVRSKCLTF